MVLVLLPEKLCRRCVFTKANRDGGATDPLRNDNRTGIVRFPTLKDQRCYSQRIRRESVNPFTTNARKIKIQLSFTVAGGSSLVMYDHNEKT